MFFESGAEVGVNSLAPNKRKTSEGTAARLQRLGSNPDRCKGKLIFTQGNPLRDSAVMVARPWVQVRERKTREGGFGA